MALQLRRGTDAQRNSKIFADGELVWTTTGSPNGGKLYVGDGVTAGGINVLKNVAGNGVSWNENTQKLDFVQENLTLTTANVPEGQGGGIYFTAVRAVDTIFTALNSGGPSGISFTHTPGTTTIRATVNGASLLPPATGNEGKWLTLDNSGNPTWHTAPLPGGLSIPAFPGNQGSYLTTDGTNLVWAQIAVNTLSGGAGNTHFASLNVATGEFTTTGNINSGGDIKLNQGKDIVRYNGASYVSVLGGLQQVVGDTAPSLGGNLTLNSRNITGTGNIDIIGTVTATSYATVVTSSLRASLGANLVLGNYNITGNGDININGAIQANTYTGNVTTPSLSATLGANLVLNSHDIGGTGNININGSIANNTLTIRGTTFTSSTSAPPGAGFYSSAPITVGTAATPATLYINSNHALGVLNGIASGTENSALHFKMSRGTLAAPTILSPNDPIGLIQVAGYDGTGYTVAGAFGILVDPATTIATGDVRGAFGAITIGFGGQVNNLLFDSRGVLDVPRLSVGDGTAANPSIVFSNDTSIDTGFYHPGDGQIGISINTQEKVHIDNGGMRVTGFVKVGTFNSALPSPPEAGMIVLANGVFKGYNGSSWVDLG